MLRLLGVLLCCIMLGGSVSAAEPVVLVPNIPESAKRFEVPLTVRVPQRGEYGGGRGSQAQATALPGDLGGLKLQKSYRTAFELTGAPSGQRLLLLVAGGINSPAFDFALLERNPDGQLVLVTEGNLERQQGSVELKGDPRVLGTNQVTVERPLLSLAVQGWTNSPDDNSMIPRNISYSFGPALNLQGVAELVGDLTLQLAWGGASPWDAKSAGIVSYSIMKGRQQLEQRAGMPEAVTEVAGIKVVVESLMSDLSSARVAVVEGDPANLLKTPMEIGKPLPAFARVDLLNRRIVTRETLLSGLPDKAHLFLILGEFPTSANPYQGQQPTPAALPIHEATITQLLRTSSPDAVVVLVVEAIPISKLYGEYIENSPPFMVLSSWSNPERIQISNARTQQFGGMGPQGDGDNAVTLRRAFGIYGQTPLIVAVGKDGNIADVLELGAQSDSLSKLLEMANRLKGK